MTPRDRGVVVGLAAILVLLAVAIGVPAGGPAAIASGGPSASLPSASVPISAVGYREGIVGRPGSIDPLTAQTQVDRDIVALVFSGLARLGPDGTVVPDLASGWTIADKGKSYTFTIRSDARWQDGQPVTSADVVFTIKTLQDPAYTGPGASSWREVTVTAVDDMTVRFDLATALGNFLEAVTQPLLPSHLLGDVAVADLATAPFNDAPIGSGPYRLLVGTRFVGPPRAFRHVGPIGNAEPVRVGVGRTDRLGVAFFGRLAPGQRLSTCQRVAGGQPQPDRSRRPRRRRPVRSRCPPSIFASTRIRPRLPPTTRRVSSTPPRGCRRARRRRLPWARTRAFSRIRAPRTRASS